MASNADSLYTLERTGSSASVHSQSTHYTDTDVDDLIAHIPEPEDPEANLKEHYGDEAFDHIAVGDLEVSFDATPPLCTPSSGASSSILGKRKSTDSGNQESAKKPHAETSTSPLNTYILADYSPLVTDGLLFGVQWEIARLKGRSSKIVMGDLQLLRKSVTHKEQVQHLNTMINEDFDLHVSLYPDEFLAKSPWEELDLELMALSNDPFGLIGCNEEESYLTANPSWHGGKVHFTCKLVKTDKSKRTDSLKLVLEEPVLGPSCRFTRRFGSESFIRVKVSRDIMRSGVDLQKFFRQSFVFNDRVYKAFYAKDTTVFMIHVANELYSKGDPSSGLKFLAFIEWHNPMKYNLSQSMAKYTARFQLGVSNSIPGVRIQPEDYLPLKDIENVDSTFKGKVPSELTMTDGSGFVGWKVLSTLYHKFEWDVRPTAIQYRLNGAKGLLLKHPTFMEDTHKVWTRPSQRKISYPLQNPPDKAQYTIDVLRSSHMSSPARLSTEILINLAENGVSVDTLSQFMRTGINERVKRFLEWDEHNLLQLWWDVSREGNVFSARLARSHVGLARAHGLRYEDPDDDSEDEFDLDEEVVRQSSAWWDDPISGQPSSLEETVMKLILGGFHPSHNPVLQTKLAEVARKAVRKASTKFTVDVPQSCTALIIPDPWDVLEPGEVQIRRSSKTLVDGNGDLTDIILGDVLLTRHPCKVASDVQKAKAVNKPQLAGYTDVIIISTKGHIVNGHFINQHLASMTGGGDYDGDLMHAYWVPEILEQFKEADPSFAQRPAGIEDHLVKSHESVTEFLERVPRTLPVEKRIYELQAHLLSGLSNPDMVGSISMMWETSMYINGYTHPQTVMLAHLFCEVLDGSKTGVTINPAYYRDLQKEFSQSPPWKVDPFAKDKPKYVNGNHRPVIRPPELGPFIMDELRRQVNVICEDLHIQIDKKLVPEKSMKGRKDIVDLHLTKPWRDAEERALYMSNGDAKASNPMRRALEAIKAHVHDVRVAWKTEYEGLRHKTATKSATDAPIEHRQDVLRRVSRKFADGPVQTLAFSDAEWTRLKASYAYLHDAEEKDMRGFSRFPFDVACRELCMIKSQAVSQGRVEPVIPKFYEAMTLNRGHLKKIG